MATYRIRTIINDLTEDQVRDNYPQFEHMPDGVSNIRIDHHAETLPVTGEKVNVGYILERVDVPKPSRAPSNK